MLEEREAPKAGNRPEAGATGPVVAAETGRHDACDTPFFIITPPTAEATSCPFDYTVNDERNE